LRAVFEASWIRLQPDEQQLFAQLSVFRGGFTRAAAKTICAPEMSRPAFHRLLAALTRKSFLKHGVENGRYDIHELMRQLGAEKLAEDDMLEMKAHNSHASYFCEFLHQLGEDLKGKRQKDAVKELELDFENGRNAWNWAVSHRMFDHLQKILLLWEHLLIVWRSRVQEADNLYGILIESLEKEESLLALQLSILAFLCRARSLRILGHFDKAAQLQKKGQQLFLQPPISELRIWPGKIFVLRHLWETDVHKIRESLQQGLDLARYTRDRWEESSCLLGLGRIAYAAGEFSKAAYFLKEALTVGRLIGNQLICANVSVGLGYNAQAQFRFEEAEQWAKESLVLFSDIEDRGGLALSLECLGENYLYMGRYTQAIKTQYETLQLHEEMGTHKRTAWSHWRLSHSYLHAGEYTKSKGAVETFLSIVKDAQYERGAGLLMLGSIALIENDLATAVNCFAQSEAFMRSITFPVSLRWYQGYHVVTLVCCGELEKARQVIIDTLDAQELSPVGIILFAGIALLFWAEKRWEQATELYTLARTNPYAGKSQWVADVIGKRIDEAAAILPPDIAEAARKRGKEMDIWETAVSLLAEFSGPD